MKHIREILPAVLEEIAHRAKRTASEVEREAYPKTVDALKAYRYQRPIEDLPSDTWMA